METIGSEKLTTFDAEGRLVELESFAIRSQQACEVEDYMDLATKIATLQFYNPGYVLLYRGQSTDHKRRNSSGKFYTTIPPSIMRGTGTSTPSPATLSTRYHALSLAEEYLIEEFAERYPDEKEKIARQRILRWSILQHYEICKTPLIDVTQSLRIAASFASQKKLSEAYVFVIGVPNISGAITASAEAGLQIVRLSNVCPPTALRPHLQEGFLLGEYPDLVQYEQKKLYSHVEIDFGRRLLGKFKFRPRDFWTANAHFPMVGKTALYPNQRDPVYKLSRRIKTRLAPAE